MAKAKKRTRSERGTTPFHYAKRTLVTIPVSIVEKDYFEGDQRAFETVDRPEDYWIVRTRREERVWTLEVSHGADKFTLPHKVLETILRHVKAIQEVEAEDVQADKSAAASARMRERISSGEVLGFQKQEAESA